MLTDKDETFDVGVDEVQMSDHESRNQTSYFDKTFHVQSKASNKIDTRNIGTVLKQLQETMRMPSSLKAADTFVDKFF